MADLVDRPADDAEIEAHRARIKAAVDVYLESLKNYMLELWKLYKPCSRWWEGTCTGISVSAKTATVTLDPFPTAAGQAGTVAGWGRKTWTAGQIVGKRVRVIIDVDSKAMVIDDVLS